MYKRTKKISVISYIKTTTKDLQKIHYEKYWRTIVVNTNMGQKTKGRIIVPNPLFWEEGVFCFKPLSILITLILIIKQSVCVNGNTFWIIPVKGFMTPAVFLVLSYSGTPPMYRGELHLIWVKAPWIVKRIIISSKIGEFSMHEFVHAI